MFVNTSDEDENIIDVIQIYGGETDSAVILFDFGGRRIAVLVYSKAYPRKQQHLAEDHLIHLMCQALHDDFAEE